MLGSPEILIEDGKSLRLIDSRGRKAFDVSGLDDSEIIRVHESLAAIVEESTPFQATICLESDAIALSGSAHGLSKLCEALSTFSTIKIEIHFGSRLEYVFDLLKFVAQLRKNQIVNGPIMLCGQFATFSEDDLDRLLMAGCSIWYLIGLNDDEFDDVDITSIRNLTDFGFLVPVGFLVSALNIDKIEPNLTKLMSANRSAGFGLPLISTSPYYKFASDQAKLPDAAAYCDLLVRQYERHTYNDAIFTPVNDLVRLLGYGDTWSIQNKLHRSVKLLIDSSGSVSLFRHAPALGFGWTGIEEIPGLTRDEVVDSLFEFAREKFNWGKNAYCCSCRWRLICGGIDAFEPGSIDIDLLETMCKHRELFLEHFAASIPAASVSRKVR